MRLWPRLTFIGGCRDGSHRSRRSGRSGRAASTSKDVDTSSSTPADPAPRAAMRRMSCTGSTLRLPGSRRSDAGSSADALLRMLPDGDRPSAGRRGSDGARLERRPGEASARGQAEGAEAPAGTGPDRRAQGHRRLTGSIRSLDRGLLDPCSPGLLHEARPTACSLTPGPWLSPVSCLLFPDLPPAEGLRSAGGGEPHSPRPCPPRDRVVSAHLQEVHAAAQRALGHRREHGRGHIEL